MQVFDAFVVSSFRTDFTDTHKFLSGDGNGVLKSFGIPELKDSHIEANVSRVKAIVERNPLKKSTKLKDVVHDMIIDVVIS